ncbi:hypothetical protein FB446DRAFT_392370 [Lentinula raphanica]|nr:hypothetical protein FB446DRAFT_392370 [Lentinula raphanica]
MLQSSSMLTAVLAVGAVSAVLAAPIPKSALDPLDLSKSAVLAPSVPPVAGQSIDAKPVSGEFNVAFDDNGHGVDVPKKPKSGTEIIIEVESKPDHGGKPLGDPLNWAAAPAPDHDTIDIVLETAPESDRGPAPEELSGPCGCVDDPMGSTLPDIPPPPAVPVGPGSDPLSSLLGMGAGDPLPSLLPSFHTAGKGTMSDSEMIDTQLADSHSTTFGSSGMTDTQSSSLSISSNAFESAGTSSLPAHKPSHSPQLTPFGSPTAPAPPLGTTAPISSAAIPSQTPTTNASTPATPSDAAVAQTSPAEMSPAQPTPPASSPSSSPSPTSDGHGPQTASSALKHVRFGLAAAHAKLGGTPSPTLSDDSSSGSKGITGRNARRGVRQQFRRAYGADLD